MNKMIPSDLCNRLHNDHPRSCLDIQLRLPRTLHNRREGSKLDADLPAYGVTFACRSTPSAEAHTITWFQPEAAMG